MKVWPNWFWSITFTEVFMFGYLDIYLQGTSIYIKNIDILGKSMYNLNYFNIIHEISLFNVSNFNGLSY